MAQYFIGGHAPARCDRAIGLDQFAHHQMIGFGIDDIDVAVQFEAQTQFGQLLFQDATARDDGGAHDAFVQRVANGTQHALILAFAIDDADAAAARGLEHRQHQLARSRRLTRQAALIFVQVQRLLGDAAVHRRAGDGHCDLTDQARVERGGDDIVGAEHQLATAIGLRHAVMRGHAGEGGDRIGGGDLHRFVDLRRAHVQRATEDIGEAQDVIDLVGIVRPAGGDDRVRAYFARGFGADFRLRIGEREDQRIGRHQRQPFGLQHARRGQP